MAFINFYFFVFSHQVIRLIILFYPFHNEWKRFCLSMSIHLCPLQNVPVNSIIELSSSLFVHNRQTRRRSAPRLDCVRLMVPTELGHTHIFNSPLPFYLSLTICQ